MFKRIFSCGVAVLMATSILLIPTAYAEEDDDDYDRAIDVVDVDEVDDDDSDEAENEAADKETDEEPDDDDRESASVHKGQKVWVEATAYSAYDLGNGHYTATGERLRRGIIAVDPSFIPLGTRVYIPGYGEAVAADTGGAIVGNIIDIAFDSHAEAMAFGRQEIQITIISEP